MVDTAQKLLSGPTLILTSWAGHWLARIGGILIVVPIPIVVVSVLFSIPSFPSYPEARRVQFDSREELLNRTWRVRGT